MCLRVCPYACVVAGLVDSKLQYPAYPTLAYNYSIQRQGA